MQVCLWESLMFEQTFVDGIGKTSRGWTVIVSFLGQICLIGIAVIIPMIYFDALPKGQLTSFLVAPPPPPPPPPPPAAVQQVQVRKIVSELDNGQLKAPAKIPQKIAMIREEDTPPPSVGGGVVGAVGGVPGGQMGGVIGGIINSTPVAVPKVATPQRVRVSQGVTEGLLVHKVTPSYPPLARQARIQGSVVLAALIGKDGSIQNLKVVSGHPMLTSSALEAVRQWKYKPYFLNGEPVEVDTQVTVN